MAQLYEDVFGANKQQEQIQNPALDGVDLNAPLTGEEVAEAIKLRTAGQIDWNPTHEDFLAYNEWNKNRHIEVMDGLMEGGMAVLGDLGNAVGAVFDHPLEATAKFAPSVVEAFMQGSRNLYGMVAQSADPNSALFKWKNALSHDGSVDGYNQFIEALDFNKRSAELASGKDTILINKDYIDHDITLAASYIADPTLFIPFGTVASAGLKAAGLGERVAMLGARVEALKAGIIGGGLKMSGGAIEVVGGATRATMDSTLRVGGNVLETATGISAKEWQATARMSGLTGSFANMLGADIAGVSGLSGTYVASGAARGFGEAIGAVGGQMVKQGGKRGFNSFAVEALRQTPNLSAHAQKLLKVLDSVDPMLSYANTIGTGMAHGAVIGGGLGYLSAGKEGMAHGMGAGIALGGVGAGLGRMYADYTGGTWAQRAEVQGTFVMENLKLNNSEKYNSAKKLLDDATAAGDRGAALQIIAGLDKVAPNMRMITGNTAELTAFLKSKGFDVKGYKIDPITGQRIKDKDGKDILRHDLDGIEQSEGGVFNMHIDNVNGEKQVTMFLNTDHTANTTYHHELFHAVFKETVMKDFFKDKLSSLLLGEYENGVKVKNGEVNPKDFKKFAEKYYEARHKGNPEFAKEELRKLDVAISEWERAKKLGKDATMGADGNQQAGKAAQHLEYMVEEFGAYYFSQMMKGKPLDYLFKGGNLGGIRGAFDSAHSSFLDFFEARAKRLNPEAAGRFNFDSNRIDAGFGEATKVNPVMTGRRSNFRMGGKRTRIGAIDYLMEDLIRTASSKNPNSASVDIKTWTPEARQAFFEGRGADGLKFQFDKNGIRVSREEEKRLKAEHGKAVFDALSTLDPSLVKDGVISGTLSDAHIEHLIKERLVSAEMGNRIKQIQKMVHDSSVPNIISYDYHGWTKERAGDVDNPKRDDRRRGDFVPITQRESVVFGYKFSVNKEGKAIMQAEVLDKKVLDMRGNREWAKPDVRALFGENRDAFDKAFIEYIQNANKDSSDTTRIPSEQLPLLEVGDGKGALRRNIMHQVAGFAKAKGVDYINPPISEIKRNTEMVRHNVSVDLMSNVKSETTTRFNFNDKNAFSDISRNFKPSEMESEKTANGVVYKHQSGSSALKLEDGTYNAYDSSSKLVGKFKTQEEVASALERNYYKEQVDSDKNVSAGKKIQEKHQGSFKVIDDATREEAKKTGNIFSTAWGKEFVGNTKVIPQTREEFYLSSMIKLRQAKPEVVLEVVKAKYAEIQSMRARMDELVRAYDAEWDRAGMQTTKTKAIQKELRQLKPKVSKLELIDFAVRSDNHLNANGNHILEVFNNLRENNGAYLDIARGLFGDAYDKQFQTGKGFTTTATHGTFSDALLKSMEFDAKMLGEKGRHGSPHDSVGAFLAGSTTTSHSYSGDNTGVFRQVRALVKMENPFVVDMAFEGFTTSLYGNIFKQAKAGGHDGVVIKNVYDGGGGADTVYVPFAEKLKDNTAILDTVRHDSNKVTVSEDRPVQFTPADRPATGRGTTILPDIERGSYKPSDDVSKWKQNRETGAFDYEGKPTNVRIVDPARFARFARKAKEDAKFGSSVSVDSQEGYKAGKHTLIMAGDGLAHASISEDGELGSIVKGKNGSAVDVENVIRAAISTGKVKWLNGFETILPEKYSEFGFEATARLKWNEEYKPENWDVELYKKYSNGRPDVIFMSYKGDNARPYAEVRDSLPVASEYDQAGDIAKAQANKFNSESVLKEGTNAPVDEVKKGQILKELSSHPEGVKALEQANLPSGERTSNYVTLDNVNAEQLRGTEVLMHSPDDAGIPDKGGMRFPLLFNEDGWAGISTGLSDRINRIGWNNYNKGKGWIAPVGLIKGEPMKNKGVHTGLIHFTDFLKELRSKNLLSEQDVKNILVDNLGEEITKGIETSDGIIKKLIDVSSEHKISVAFRGLFVLDSTNGGKPNTLWKLLKDKLPEVQAIVKGSKLEGLTTKDGFDKALLNPLYERYADPILKDVKVGDVYAYVVFRSPLKDKPNSKAHPSYPTLASPNKAHPDFKPVQLDILSKPISAQKAFTGTVTMGDEAGSFIDKALDPTNVKSFHSSTAQGNMPYAHGSFKVSEDVKKGVRSVDSTIAKINKTSVVSSGILNALDDFKEALRRQDATDEVLVPEVEQSHKDLISAINQEMASSSNASLPDLKLIKKTVEGLSRNIKKNQSRITKNAIRANADDMTEGADLEAEQVKVDVAKKQEANRKAYQEDMQSGADIESEQAFDVNNPEPAPEAQAQPSTQQTTQPSPEPSKPAPEPYMGLPEGTPRVVTERDAWRVYSTERTPNGSIYKNSKGYSITLSNNKLRVYNPQNALLGIYLDLDQAKRRVQREEPKAR